MSGTKSKAKGKRGEQIICTFLSEQLGGNFQRVPGSGAYLGGKNQVRAQYMSESQQLLAKGDIIPPDNLKHLVLESKNYKDFPFQNLMKEKDIPQLEDWVSQVQHDASEDDLWFLIFKIDRKGSFIVFDQKHPFVVKNSVHYKHYVITEFENFVIANKDLILQLGA